MSPTWETAADWDGAASEDGVVHEATTNTDHGDAALLKQGHSAANPYLSSDLVLYYPFHEDSGSTAYDFSGGGNDGTISGVELGQTGLLGTTAYSFDGVDDTVEFPTLGSTFNGSYTVSFWLYNQSNGVNDYQIFAPRAQYDSGRVWGDDSGNHYIAHSVYDGSTEHRLTTTQDFDTWAHIVALWDSSAGMELWRNATLDDSNTFTGSPATLSGTNLIGEAFGNYYGGRVADVRAYDRALSSSEIQTLYDVVAANSTLVTSEKLL